jgi:hypothetical protein
MQNINGTVPVSINKGTWHYDYTNKQARFDHDAGQVNNFCQGSDLQNDRFNPPIKNGSGNCQLLFQSNGHMKVIFPDENRCCELCNSTKQGCTPLKPTWLSQATFWGQIEVGGRKCDRFCEPGSAAAEDCWSQDSEGVPCNYFEYFLIPSMGNFSHNMDFDAKSYSKKTPSADIFAEPSYCTEKCLGQIG